MLSYLKSGREQLGALRHYSLKKSQYTALQIRHKGFSFVSGPAFKRQLGTPNELAHFSEYWERLELDPYMPDGGTYRQRRFARFEYHPRSDRLLLQPKQGVFFQSSSINSFAGGIARNFSKAELSFTSSQVLRRLIRHNVEQLHLDKEKKIYINTHLFRVLSQGGGHPTPEGIHRDGHAFVSQHLISRKNIMGGVSGIYNQNHQPLVHRQLHEPFDTIYVDDRRVKHDVSPVLPTSDEPGHRDMLIIDYNFKPTGS